MTQKTRMVDFVSSVSSVFTDVHNEFWKAAEKWGIQNHPTRVNLMVLLEEVGEVAEAEELIAIKPSDTSTTHLYEELIQVAAMAIMCAESLTRNGYRDLTPECSSKGLITNKVLHINRALQRAYEAGNDSRAYLEQHYYPQCLHVKNSEPYPELEY